VLGIDAEPKDVRMGMLWNGKELLPAKESIQ
jgi:hypothetical protein